MKKVLLLLLISFTSALVAQNIPHYKLTIAPSDLALMYAAPKDEVYYPAIFQFGPYTYNVQARFKGSTSLNYPKKSWAIKFNNSSNYFGVSRINLHADYKDYSAMRNFLIMKLFAQLGSPASKIQHVTYEVNGEPYGVYTQVEQIDSEYLARNARFPVSLYKANNHGALMAPTVRDDYYERIWEIEAGGDYTFNELRNLFNKCLYWSADDFNANVESIIDVDNFLNFFAIHYVMVSMDNFTKNIFLNKNSHTLKYELFPWDNEGSFGNSAIGVFDSTLVNYNMREAYTPEYQVVFQRMLENPSFRSRYKDKINRVLTEGYSLLDTLIDNTYQRIKHPVYADTKKEATNADFDNSIPRLKWFLEQRKTFIQNNDLPERNALIDFYCSNPFPTATNPMVTFRVKSPVVQHVNMFFADSINYEKMGEPFKFSRAQLYDDGLHDDLLPNDLIYGNTINTNNFVSSLVPFAITGAEQNYPPNGIFYVDYYRSKSYAINKGNFLVDVAAHVKVGKVYRHGGNNFVEIINTSSTHPIDLSYCHLRTNDSSQDFMFRDKVILAPNETIYIAPSKELGNAFFPDKRSFSNLYYSIPENSNLHIYSPVFTPMTSSAVQSVQSLVFVSPILVINEINYRSGNVKQAGDWVEIYNPGNTAVDMTNWIFKDGENGHNFRFPAGYSLPSDGYVVVAEDITAFASAYPDVKNVVGSTGFGLSGTGEAVRLYDNVGQLVDSVYYGIMYPWPSAANGTGATLELENHALDNTVGSNWYADTMKYGSPGRQNFNTTDVRDVESALYALYPNPARDIIFIRANEAEMQVELLTLQGAVVKNIQIFGAVERQIDISDLAPGMYLVRVTANGKQQTEKLIVR